MDDALFRNGGELGRAMAARDWSSTAVGSPADVARRAAQHGPDRPDLPLLHVGGVGPGADDLLQRRVLARHPAGQAPVGARPAGGRDVGGDLGRHRPAHPGRCSRPASPPGTRTCCCSSSAAATPRRPTTPSPTARSTARTAASRACSAWSPRPRPAWSANAAWPQLRDLAAAVAAHAHRARRARPPWTPKLGRNLADLPFSLTYLIDEGRQRAPGRLLRDRTRLARCADDSGRRGRGRVLAAGPTAHGRAGRGRGPRRPDQPTCPPGRGSSHRTPPSPSRWPPRPRSTARRPASSSSGSTRTGRSTTATAGSSTCWPARSPRGWSTPAATRRSAGGPSRSPSSTGRRRTSSPTSATSSGPRSR